MVGVSYDDVWEDLKNENENSKIAYKTAEDLSRFIIELIEARVDRGYSQRDLAEKCGLKQSAIARMESLRTVPRLDTVIKVANALNVVISINRVVMQLSGTNHYHSTEANSGSYYIYSDDEEKINIGELAWNPSSIIS